jgi:hypothetical protein
VSATHAAGRQPLCELLAAAPCLRRLDLRDCAGVGGGDGTAALLVGVQRQLQQGGIATGQAVVGGGLREVVLAGCGIVGADM